MKLAGKITVLTGAGSGIGRALAQEIVRGGGRVVGLDIRAEGLAETGARLGEGFSARVLDVTDKAAVAALPAQIEQEHGPVDCLINCAGMIQPFVRFGDLSDETIERVLNVNFFGTLAMTRAFLPHLLARPEAQLVNFGSMSSIAPLPGQSIYGVSKAAIKLLTESLYAEYLGTNLSVTLILPGAVATAISANSGIEMPTSSSNRPREVATAEAAAQTILAGIETNAFRVLVDKMVIDVDTAYRADPQAAVEGIARNFGGLLGG